MQRERSFDQICLIVVEFWRVTIWYIVFQFVLFHISIIIVITSLRILPSPFVFFLTLLFQALFKFDLIAVYNFRYKCYTDTRAESTLPPIHSSIKVNTKINQLNPVGILVASVPLKPSNRQTHK